MKNDDGPDWPSLNKDLLAAAIDEVRQDLDRYANKQSAPSLWQRLAPSWPAASAKPAGNSALDRLCRCFGLSSFERRVLLLAAGMELDGRFPSLCAAAAGTGGSEAPSFALALAVFGDAHWTALSPDAPLRYWRLIELGKGPSLVHSPLRIDEGILCFLLGQATIDNVLLPHVETLPSPGLLAESQAQLAERIAQLWSQPADPLPVIQLIGLDEGPAPRAAAAAACGRLGLGVIALAAASLPAAAEDVETLVRLCERQAALSDTAILLDCDDLDEPDGRETAVQRLIDRLEAPLILTGRRRRRGGRRPLLTFDVAKPTAAEQEADWRDALGQVDSARPLARRLAAQFHLDRMGIAAVCADARARLALDTAERPGTGDDGETLAGALWDSVRLQSRPKLDNLAQRVEPAAGWDDLILPDSQHHTLRAIAAQISHRSVVHDDWGFAAQGERGLGLAVLFTGSSGTGKTTAAEVLARALRLDLYRVDLSQVVSKYIGETEKNLRRVFDAADEGGVILLFDEADALFGKRTEVSDSHDRHANVEVSYLLQRVEAFRGLAILTSNMKAAIDAAFLRRLRFIVSFPFPDAALRARIWARMFPPKTPTEGLDMTKLAQLALSGGQIRAVALNAAFLAAAAGRAVGMADIRTAARMEYAKQEKTLSDAELKGWPP